MMDSMKFFLRVMVATVAFFVGSLGVAGVVFAYPISVGGVAGESLNKSVQLNDGSVLVMGNFGGESTFGNFVKTSTFSTRLNSYSSDVYVYKMNSDGAIEWVATSEGESNTGWGGIDVMPDGSAIISGTFGDVNGDTVIFGSTTLTVSGLNRHGFIAKLDPSGNWVWAKRIAGMLTYSPVKVAPDGSIVFAGTYSGTLTAGSNSLISAGDNDGVIIRFDQNGNVIWAKRFGDSGPDIFRDVSVFSDGNILVAGYSGPRILIVRYDLNGNIVWQKKDGLDQYNRNAFNAIEAVETLSNGSAMVGGFFHDTMNLGSLSLTSSGNGDVFVAKIDKNGNWIWANRGGGNDGNYVEQLYDIEVSGSDNSAFVTGHFGSNALFGQSSLVGSGYSSGFVAKISDAGSWVWANQVTGTNVSGAGVLERLDGYVLLFGHFTSGNAYFGLNLDDGLTAPSNNTQIFVALLNGEGLFVDGVNSMPTSDSGFDQQASEGSIVVFDGSSSSDPDGVADIVSYAWDFGDGTMGSGVTATHAYADNGTYTVTLTVTDSQGASDSDTAVVTVANVAPVVSLPFTTQAFETDTITVSGSFVDPGADSWTVTADYGDGTLVEAIGFANKTFTLAHTYLEAGLHTVTVTVTDDDGGIGTAVVEVATYSVIVPAGQNVTVSLSGVTMTFGEVTTGGVATIVVTDHPQGGNPPSQYRFLNTYYELTTTAGYVGPITVAFAYDETDVRGLEANLKLFHWDGTNWQNITTGVDTTGNVITGSTLTLSPFAVGDLLNTPPSLGDISINADPRPVNAVVQASASFSDTGVDTHTAIWNWGDGVTGGGIVDETNGSVTGEHAYPNPGVYSVSLTVTDSFGEQAMATYTYVVVYDPAGGYVTGGGWIMSPPNAYWVDPLLTGKASFGFNAKYLPGAQTPSGGTEFQFKAGSLNFRSSEYEWLVVAGAQAKYKGTGTVNGAGDYGFMLSAWDSAIEGGGTADAFRIKIWDRTTGQVVYDNQMGESDEASAGTLLGGGSIVIHK